MRPPKQAQRNQTLLVGLLLCAMLAPIIGGAAPSNAKSLQRKKAAIQSNIRNARTHLRSVKAKEQHKANELRGVESRLRMARGQLQVATVQMERSKVELHRANLALAEAKQEYTKSRKQAADRLVAVYERGDHGYLRLLVTANDMGELLQRSQIATFMADHDREALANLREQREALARHHNRAAQKAMELAAWKQRVAILHNRTDSKRRATVTELRKVSHERQEWEAELAALERDSAEVTSMLQRLARSSAGKRRHTTAYTGSVSGLPVRGRITSPFGYRIHPVLKYRRLHTGVDIAAPSGTPIVSAGGGEVVFAGWRGGYGNTVIIDHGGGRATLYGHMSSITARSGQVVKRGQMIGRVGSTGISTGPHLHYEVRINGKPVNPL